MNTEKSKVVKATECEFLGFTFTGKKIRWTSKTLHRFKQKILKLTGRSWGVSMPYRLRKLAEYILRLGVDALKAACIGVSDKGHYRLSRTYEVQLGLNDKYLSDVGLVSLKDLWVRFHYHR